MSLGCMVWLLLWLVTYPVFLSSFWQELFTLQGVQLHKSTTFHPQTNGQTEVLNMTLETYLRCFCLDNPLEWLLTCLLLSGGTTQPIIQLSNAPLMKFFMVKSHIFIFPIWAQQRMRDLANMHRFDRQFSVGDWVYLKLQSYRQFSVATRPYKKLVAKYFGPYLIDAKIGEVAYRLLLPADVLIHPTFHVSQLKKCHAVPVVLNHTPVLHMSSPYCPLPEAILERRMIKRGNKVVGQVLVKWLGVDPAQATWEILTELQHRFPSFQP
ncbi:hypothetical protein MTR67_031002 [Solanum verrucosum]|uniref:Chromo domain-containing protein n=1 Tax=Solanum verrucosum TaxID=315347 RepID=A0AAF0U1P2_SOLVR|nr:hypothetical protein MTR67_031002 [Solanum verrucosum]